MLILTRRVGEEIMIGDEIRIVVISTAASSVKIGIHAPRDIEVHRKEVYDRVVKERQ